MTNCRRPFSNKNMRDRNSPTCTLSHNGYDDKSANAWKHTCFLALGRSTAAHVCWALGLIYFPVRPPRYQRIPGNGFQRKFGPLLQHVQCRCEALWKCPCRLVVARVRQTYFCFSVKPPCTSPCAVLAVSVIMWESAASGDWSGHARVNNLLIRGLLSSVGRACAS